MSLTVDQSIALLAALAAVLTALASVWGLRRRRRPARGRRRWRFLIDVQSGVDEVERGAPGAGGEGSKTGG